MPTTPNQFDYWREGEVFPGLAGKSSGFTFDYWREGEVLPDPAPSAAVAATNDVSTSAAISALATRDVATTAALGRVATRDVSTAAALSATAHRDIATTAALSTPAHRDAGTTAAISHIATKDVATSAAISEPDHVDVSTVAALATRATRDVATEASIASGSTAAHVDVATAASIELAEAPHGGGVPYPLPPMRRPRTVPVAPPLTRITSIPAAQPFVLSAQASLAVSRIEIRPRPKPLRVGVRADVVQASSRLVMATLAEPVQAVYPDVGPVQVRWREALFHEIEGLLERMQEEQEEAVIIGFVREFVGLGR